MRDYKEWDSHIWWQTWDCGILNNLEIPQGKGCLSDSTPVFSGAGDSSI